MSRLRDIIAPLVDASVIYYSPEIGWQPVQETGELKHGFCSIHLSKECRRSVGLEIVADDDD